MQINEDRHTKCKALIGGLDAERQLMIPIWQDIANYVLPQRYIWLTNPQDRRSKVTRNPNQLDGTGYAALTVLSNGMMNGITSPLRPWMKIRLANFGDDISWPVREWLDEVERRMFLVFASSNFYNGMGVLFRDMCGFGTAAMLIYEDEETVIRCYNSALGEFYVGQSDRGVVNTFARKFQMNTGQMVSRFGLENCPDAVKTAYSMGAASLTTLWDVWHLIEPNIGDGRYAPSNFKFSELYWANGPTGDVLSAKGFNELPGIFPRWEVTANDTYGTSPTMMSLGDIIQLQHETLAKGKGLDYMLQPPTLADISMQGRPTALIPKGITYVAGLNAGTIGAKPIYTVQPPIRELTEDIREIQARIREFHFNDLFQMISQLDTVRSATEIDARREEKLVLLGPVLERFENEALDPGIRRTYSIMQRMGLLPDPPPEIQGQLLTIQYTSILSTAQAAAGLIPTERFLSMIGNVAALYPPAADVPDFDELLVDYGRALGVKAKGIRSPDAIAQSRATRQQNLDAQNAANTGLALTQGAQNLSKVDVGGGQNAMQRMLGG